MCIRESRFLWNVTTSLPVDFSTVSIVLVCQSVQKRRAPNCKRKVEMILSGENILNRPWIDLLIKEMNIRDVHP